MNHDVTRIIDRYLHRYSVVRVQRRWWNEFGRWWDDDYQCFFEGRGRGFIAMYRKQPISHVTGNRGVYRLIPADYGSGYRFLTRVAPLPKKY